MTRLWISLQNRKLVVFLAILVSSTLVYSSIGFYLLSAAPSQPFIAIGIFSEKGTLSDYYKQNNDLNLTVGQSFQWHVQIENQAGSIQLAKIIFRLGNITSSSPTESDSSTVPELGESALFIPSGDNGTIMFNWSLASYSDNGSLRFPTLQVNGETVSSQIGASRGIGFRFIFELWTLNEQTGEYEYSAPSRNDGVGVYGMIWFNIP